METHHVLLALPTVLAELHNGSIYHDVRLRACNSLIKIHKIFADNDVFLSDAASEEALRCADDFLLEYNVLCRAAIDRIHMMYPIQFKTHMMWHSVWFSQLHNPRWTACFEFEELMGKVTVCVQQAMYGTSLSLIGSKILEHFLLSFHLRLNDQEY